MPNRKRDARRLLINRLILAVREIGRKCFGDSDRAAILCAIGIGRQEGRLLDVSGISAMTGLSRQTVLRHLNQMTALGEVRLSKEGGRTLAVATPPRINHDNTVYFFVRVEALVTRCAAELSKTDT